MSLKEGSVRSPADKACDVQRDGINIFCFITLHKERNIQQSLPPETGLGRGINTTWTGEVFYQQHGDMKTEKASTDPSHYPHGLRPWARPIGLQSTALTHLHTHTRRQAVG